MKKYNILQALAFEEGTKFNIEKQEGTRYVEPIRVYGKTKRLYDAEGKEVTLNSKSARMVLTKSREYVTIQKAMKAFIKEITIGCNINGETLYFKHKLKSCVKNEIERLIDNTGRDITPEEIMKGKW